jgi:hypothetical protein
MVISDLMSKRKFKRVMRRGMRAGRRAYRRYDVDDMLQSAGLERRSIAADIAADLGFFAIGCLCGAVAGVFFAPKPGLELRDNFKKAINEKGVWGGINSSVREQIGGQA